YDGAMIEHNYGMWLLAQGALAGAREVQLEARRRATRLGLAYTTRLVDGVLGCILYHAGEWDRAERVIGRVLQGEGGSSGHGPALEAHTVMARIEIARGDVGSADEHAGRAAALAREMGEPQYLVSSLG